MTPLVKILIAVLSSTFLFACKNDQKIAESLAWDGVWERTITVPEGLQGRCVDEILELDGKLWRTRATIHSTFKCDQPYLELVFQGTINQVHIKKGSKDKDIRLQVSDIKLVQLVDIVGDKRHVIDGDSAANMSPRYVREDQEFFEQFTFHELEKKQLKAQVYQPVLDVAIPKYPNNGQLLSYKRKS